MLKSNFNNFVNFTSDKTSILFIWLKDKPKSTKFLKLLLDKALRLLFRKNLSIISKDILDLSSENKTKKIGISEERLEAIKPYIR